MEKDRAEAQRKELKRTPLNFCMTACTTRVAPKEMDTMTARAYMRCFISLGPWVR